MFRFQNPKKKKRRVTLSSMEATEQGTEPTLSSVILASSTFTQVPIHTSKLPTPKVLFKKAPTTKIAAPNTQNSNEKPLDETC